MDQIKPYLFWIVLGAVLVALVVVRFVVVGSIIAEADTRAVRFDRTHRDLNAIVLKGEKVERPALIERVKERAEKYANVVDLVQDQVIDVDSEFWPEADYINFRKPPKQQELMLLMVQYRGPLIKTIREVSQSVRFVRADPALGRHRVQFVGGADPHIESPRTADLRLQQVLGIMRRLWLRKELNRILTDPEVDIKVVHALEHQLTDRLGYPTGETPGEPFVRLEWFMDVELPIERVPVLLSRLAMSRRHLIVRNFQMAAVGPKIIDVRQFKEPLAREIHERYEGHLVRATVGGESFDFLIARTRLLYPPDILNWKALLTRLAKEGPDAGAPSPCRRIWNLLSEEGRTEIRSAAAILTAATGGETPELGSDTRTNLLGALNEVLKNRDFYQDEDFAGLQIGREAANLLERRADLPEGKVHRLNRLLLESAFPKAIATNYHGWPT